MPDHQLSGRRWRIRRARPGEAGQLSGLARRSKAHWGYDAEFLERVAAELTIPPRAIAEHQVWVLEADGRLIGFHRVIPGEPAVLEDLWLEPEAIGAGHGRRLWEHAVGWRGHAAPQRWSWTPSRTPWGSTSRPPTNALARQRRSARPKRPPTRPHSSSNSSCQQAGSISSTLWPAATRRVQIFRQGT